MHGQGQGSGTLMPQIVKRVLHNLQVHIKDIHIRVFLEDGYAMSITCESLELDTADDLFNKISAKSAEKILTSKMMYKLLNVRHLSITCKQKSGVSGAARVTQAVAFNPAAPFENMSDDIVRSGIMNCGALSGAPSVTAQWIPALRCGR